MRMHGVRGTLFSLVALGATTFFATHCSSDATDPRVGQGNEALTGGLDADGFSPADWARLHTLSPLPDLPFDPTNEYADEPAAALFGQKIFSEPRLAGPIQVGTPANGQLGNIGDIKKIACRNCHMPESVWLYDIRSNNLMPPAAPNATALGSQWMTRNVSSLVDTVFYTQGGNGEANAHWRENDGFSDSEWFDAQSEPEGPPVQNGSRLQLAHVISEHYRADYTAAFPDWPLPLAIDDYSRFPATGSPYTDIANWNSLSPGDKDIIDRVLTNYGKGMEAFERTLTSRNAPFDQFVAGNHDAMSHEAIDGLKVFIGKGHCVQCHNQPLLSDDSFHVIGLQIDTTLSPFAAPSETGRSFNQSLICDPTVADGAFSVNGFYSDDQDTGRDGNFCSTFIPDGLWRTKGLRHVAETAPYFRDGQAKTLRDVLEFYDRGGDPPGTFIGGPKEIVPLHLSTEEKDHLIEFLKALTGEPVPAFKVADIHNP